MKPLVIFHASCRDGLCAAWVVRRHFMAVGQECEFVSAQYGDSPPDVDGRNVIVVDFSYPRPLMDEMHRRARVLTVIDHHKTAEEALRGAEYATFDMGRSGAGMAWDHLIPAPRPWIVDYVEDRDLWRFALPDSRAVNEYLQVVPLDFDSWDATALLDVAEVARLGRAIALKTDAHVSGAVKHARRVVLDGYDVPILNVTSDISEVVGTLAENEPFAIGWFQISDGGFVYSLRSRGDFDVSVIAKNHGGGGHRNAAGFKSTVLL